MAYGGRSRRLDSSGRPERLPVSLVLRPCSGAERLEVGPDGARQDRLALVLGRPADVGIRHAVPAVLWPESDSPYDSLAVGVWMEGELVGWLSHGDSARLHRLVVALARLGEALECGGFIESAGRDPFGTPLLGAWVAFDRLTAERHAELLLGSTAGGGDTTAHRATDTVRAGGIRRGGG